MARIGVHRGQHHQRRRTRSGGGRHGRTRRHAGRSRMTIWMLRQRVIAVTGAAVVGAAVVGAIVGVAAAIGGTDGSGNKQG